MSVLEVFGQNLRNLTALRGSQASVAEDLEINRVQFQRYLNFDSFPKPNVLQRICVYFGVDARIMTELLDESQLAMIKVGEPITATSSPNSLPMQKAMAYCVNDHDYLAGTEVFTDGIYMMWRGNYERKDRAQRQLISFKTVNGTKVFRGYSDLRLLPPTFGGPARTREYRGVVLKLVDGFAMLTFLRGPIPSKSVQHLRLVDNGQENASSGISMICSSSLESVSGQRVVRLYMYRLKGGVREAIRLSREHPLTRWDEVPEYILPFIRPQNECF